MSPEQMEEIKRYFGVVAEGLRNDIRRVAEGNHHSLTHVRFSKKWQNAH
jgi:hypothetical protein